MDAEQPRFVDDVVKLLKKIPEYSNALLQYKGPSIISGAEKNRSGRVFVDMTGGTEGSEEIFDKLSSSGVGTIVGMHMSEAHYENAKKYHINVVIAGHISSDTLGLNLLFNKVMKKFGTLTIIPCSGYYYLKH
jgi:putative NIF3 family GTP cyclohydrolase 1 type 2